MDYRSIFVVRPLDAEEKEYVITFANMLSGLATSSIQRSDNEYLMNRQAELNKEQADYSTEQTQRIEKLEKVIEQHKNTLLMKIKEDSIMYMQ